MLNGGVGLTSYNSFAYCSNNPIKYIDPSGNFAKDHKMTTLAPGTPWADRYVYFIPKNKVTVFFIKLEEDFNNYNSGNTNADVVFGANYFSNYKGAFVLKASFPSSFSVGFIGLSTNQQNSTVLNHEYGHTKQLEELGIYGYITKVGIPSVTAYNLKAKGSLPYNYFSSPWESQADAYGNITNRESTKRNWTENDGYYNIWDLFNSLID